MPARLSGRRVAVRLGAEYLEVTDSNKVVARHRRALHKGTETLTLNHYLEIRVSKPGALLGATALAQARTVEVFTEEHQRFWDAARRRLGDQGGTRALIEVLLEHRRLPAESIIEALTGANQAGIVDPAVVTTEARRHADVRPPAEVIPIGAPARYDRPAPSVSVYDQLLTGESR